MPASVDDVAVRWSVLAKRVCGHASEAGVQAATAAGAPEPGSLRLARLGVNGFLRHAALSLRQKFTHQGENITKWYSSVTARLSSI